MACEDSQVKFQPISNAKLVNFSIVLGYGTFKTSKRDILSVEKQSDCMEKVGYGRFFWVVGSNGVWDHGFSAEMTDGLKNTQNSFLFLKLLKKGKCRDAKVF